MAVLQYILVIGALWLVGCICLIGFVFAALVRQERSPKPAKAAKPSPQYIRRWSKARRIREAEELARFEKLLNS